MAAFMLHGVCFREEAGARNRVFFSVKWLQPAVLQRGDANRIVMAAWMCTWCCETHCNGGCMNVAWDLCCGGSRGSCGYARFDVFGSPLVVCTLRVFLCAYFYAIVESLFADRIGMAG